MLEHNQFGIKPGTYEHYKGGIYVVENILTHEKPIAEGAWTKMHDPLVIYRNLEQQFESVNGTKQYVIKTFARPLTEFLATVEIDGVSVKRFKRI